jgi:uncharacterized membrane protein
MRKAQCALLVTTGAAIALSAMSLRSDGVLNMDPMGNFVVILFWLAIPATWFVVGLRTRSESTIGFCLLLSVYYSCGLFYWLLRQEKQDPTDDAPFRFFMPYLLLMGAPFLVALESYARKLVLRLARHFPSVAP